jgi:predicted dehydrogenase
MYVDELRQFVECVRAGPNQIRPDGRQGAAVLAIGLQALRSAAQGRTIDLYAEGESIREWLSSFNPEA